MRFPHLPALALVLALVPSCGRSLVEFPDTDGGAQDAAFFDGLPRDAQPKDGKASDSSPSADTRDAPRLDTALDTASTNDARDTAVATDTRDASTADAADVAADTSTTDAGRSETGDTSSPDSDSRER
jgi:hypothetical protein